MSWRLLVKGNITNIGLQLFDNFLHFSFFSGLQRQPTLSGPTVDNGGVSRGRKQIFNPHLKKFGQPPEKNLRKKIYGISATSTIRISPEIQCFPCAGF